MTPEKREALIAYLAMSQEQRWLLYPLEERLEFTVLIEQLASESLQRQKLKACDACIDVLFALGINYETASLKQALQAISDLKHAAERPVIKLPPELEEHKSGLVGHRPTLQLKTPEWAEGYREAILDVSLINEVKYD